MLEPVELKPKKFADYQEIIGDELYNEVLKLSKKLAGKRILHINATARGGGVAEILHSMVPILQDLGIRAEWQTIEANREFFVTTKNIHNSLQGFDTGLNAMDWRFYESVNQELAAELKPDQWDIIVTHDPQPAAIIKYAAKATCQWVWRCHLDVSHPAEAARQHFSKYLRGYDGAIFTLDEYFFGDFGDCKTGVIPVAIDPLSPKNQPMGDKEARSIVSRYGLDPARPFIVQVSRFDPWKDPEGVIKAWQLAKAQVPKLQLVLVGNTADDDPQSAEILKHVRRLDRADDDLHIVADEADDRAVQAFQTTADVVIQKSIREGFGLTVAEALWAKTPVVATKVGGIPMQIEDGVSGFLADGVVETANQIIKLVHNPKLRKQMGAAGHKHIREHFLLPRLIRDHLKFISSL